MSKNSSSKFRFVSKYYKHTLFVVGVLVYFGVNLYLTNALSDRGRIIRELDEQKEELTAENRKLRNLNNELSSLSYIEEEASALGLEKGSVEFFNYGDNLASR